MHIVCVFIIHQNVKLKINALPINIDYKDLLSKITCNLTDRNCMLRNYNNCIESLKVYILKMLTDSNYNDDLIKFREWISLHR